MNTPQSARTSYLENPLLNRIRDRELAYVHVALLTKTVRPIKRLVLQSRIPPQVHEYNVIATREIEALGAVELHLSNITRAAPILTCTAGLERNKDDTNVVLRLDLLPFTLASWTFDPRRRHVPVSIWSVDEKSTLCAMTSLSDEIRVAKES